MSNRKILYLTILVMLGMYSSASAVSIEQVMSDYQAVYQYCDYVSYYVCNEELPNEKSYIRWSMSKYSGVPAPSFPTSGFFDEEWQDENKKEALVGALIGEFFGDDSIYSNFRPQGDPSGSFNFERPDASEDPEGALNQLNGYIEQLTNYYEGAGQRERESCSGGLGNFPIIDCVVEPANNCSIVHTGASDSWDQCGWYEGSGNMPIGIHSTSMESYLESYPCDGAPGGIREFYRHAANLSNVRGKIGSDLTPHSGSGTCYLRVVPVVEEGHSPPVTCDGEYHSWMGVTAGDDWESSMIGGDKPSFQGCDYQAGWNLSGACILVSPQYENGSNPVAGLGVTIKDEPYKHMKDHTVYSASTKEECNEKYGETVSGIIEVSGLTVDSDSNYYFDIKVDKLPDSKVGNFFFSGSERTEEKVYSLGGWDGEQSTASFNYSIKAIQGRGNVNFTFRVWKSEKGSNNQVNVSKAEKSVSFKIQTNGYTCCAREWSAPSGGSIFSEPQTLPTHENGNIEVYFPDINESYIVSPRCGFIDNLYLYLNGMPLYYF